MILIEIYTDGSSDGRSGNPIGWAYRMVSGLTIVEEKAGSLTHGTNNTAELIAALNGLKSIREKIVNKELPEDVMVRVVTDSQYVIGMGSGSKKASKNMELVEEVRAAVDSVNADFRWVKGHGEDEHNQAVDQAARKARQWMKMMLKKDDGLDKVKEGR